MKRSYGSVAPLLLLVGILAAFASPARADEESDYRLGPEDRLSIRVWGRPDLSGEVVVDPAGEVQLPLVGTMEAAQRTAAELSAQLKRRYQLLDPSITDVVVSVAEYNRESVTVVGEVREPGRRGFRALPDLWEVLLSAGGATAQADLSRVQIVRKQPGTGEPEAITVDLSRGIEGTPRASLPALRARDTVFVPSAAGQVIYGDAVQILGAVRNPGIYALEESRRVTWALSVSGGYLPEADLSRVHLTRESGQGPVAFELDLRDYLRRGRPQADLDLRAGDVVSVPARRSALVVFLEGLGLAAPFLTAALALTYALD